MESALTTSPPNSRQKLAESDILAAVEVRAAHELPPSGFNDRRQIAITLSGAFEYRTGGKSSWLDPMRLLFVEADQEYQDHHPIEGVGHAAVIIAPAPELLDELAGPARAAYADQVRSCPLRVQMLVQLLKRSQDPLTHDEIGSAILLSSFGQSYPVAATDIRCVRQAKSLLHEACGERLSLGTIARQLGVTPIYLTQAFKRSEGMPLYRYQTRLRLNRALAELPERDDITDLALELGFSSHSHFTAAFRQVMGVTPSHYRHGAMTRNDAETLLAA